MIETRRLAMGFSDRRSSSVFTMAAVIGLWVAVESVRAQEVILDVAFEDEADAASFFAPAGVDLCGQALPNGTISISDGELLMTNDDTVGLAMFGLDPEEVGDLFPDDTRDYKLRLLVNLESVNEFLVYLRARVGVDRDSGQIDSLSERGYAFVILPQGTSPDPRYTDGAVAIAEFGACHGAVPHPEWRNANIDGFAQESAGFIVNFEDWYWLEVSAQGRDEGGPVLLSMSLWPEDGERPLTPQLTVVDVNGIDHTDETLRPENNVEVLIGTSFDFDQQPGGRAHLDDLTITTIGGCAVPPVIATRTLFGESLAVEGVSTGIYADGETYSVSLDLADVRAAGVCDAAGIVEVTEAVPATWEIVSADNGGEILADNVVRWTLNFADGGAAGVERLTYSVLAFGSDRVEFQGELSEEDSGFTFAVGGERVAIGLDAIPEISDFGSIQRWLTLGPFTREVPGASPGEDEVIRDYVHDGDVGEVDLQPKAGDTVEPDFGGEAASTGLSPNGVGRNPGDVPTWVEWIDRDDDDDRIDFEPIYGPHDEVVCYAVTYLVAEDDLIVNFAASSDDSIHILLDGETIHVNSAGRGAEARVYQDLPFEFPSLGEVELSEGVHVLVVKVFDGGGEHNFRVGFVDEFGAEIPGGPEDLTVTTAPEDCVCPPAVEFLRGDADENGTIELTDGIRTLNFLFTGGAPINCGDAADADDNGAIELTDAVKTFGFLFLGGPPPVDPGVETCGEDPSEDALVCESYSGC